MGLGVAEDLDRIENTLLYLLSEVRGIKRKYTHHKSEEKGKNSNELSLYLSKYPETLDVKNIKEIMGISVIKKHFTWSTFRVLFSYSF